MPSGLDENGAGTVDIGALSADTMLQLAGTLSVALNREGRVTWTNDLTSRQLGGEKADLVGRNWFETFVPQSERAEQQTLFGEVVAGRTKAVERYELAIRTLDGRERITCWRHVPLRSNDGQLVGFLFGGEDVTETRGSEQMLDGLRQLVSRWTANIHVAPAEQLDDVILQSLADVGGHLEVDGITLVRISGDGIVEIGITWADQTFGTAAWVEGVLRSAPSPQFAQHMLREGLFVVGEGAEMPDWPHGQQSLGQLGARSAFAVRSGGDEQTAETIALLSRQPGRAWPDDLVPPLVCLSGAIWGAFHRRRAEAELRGALDEVTRLKLILEVENDQLRQRVGLMNEHAEGLGSSPAIRNVLGQVELVAPTNASVLLLGETGTGKELIARAIHNKSGRHDRRMVKVNCAALPAGLAEAELFGREKGAYTGADSSQAGRFELADGSTLFLDEVTELDPGVQAKLLRVLQEGEFERVGSTKTVQVNVRVIAASNRDPLALVESGRFRQDLYYRLNVFPIRVPPLRERREDIAALAWDFSRELGEAIGKPIERISRRTMEALQSYDWPGNVRELRNVIERAVILSTGGVLSVELPAVESSLRAPGMTLFAIERQYILEVLERAGWRVRGAGGAAEILGLKPTTLESRMAKLGIERPQEPGE